MSRLCALSLSFWDSFLYHGPLLGRPSPRTGTERADAASHLASDAAIVVDLQLDGGKRGKSAA